MDRLRRSYREIEIDGLGVVHAHIEHNKKNQQKKNGTKEKLKVHRRKLAVGGVMTVIGKRRKWEMYQAKSPTSLHITEASAKSCCARTALPSSLFPMKLSHRGIIPILGILSILIAAGGWQTLSIKHAAAVLAVQGNLDAIAKQKVEQISRWRDGNKQCGWSHRDPNRSPEQHRTDHPTVANPDKHRRDYFGTQGKQKRAHP